MKITHEISVDFMHRGLRPRIEIKENDLATRYVHVAFYRGGEPYAVTVATTDALMCYAKPDVTAGVYDTIGEGADQHDAAVFDIDGKGVTIELAPSMAKGFGLLHCEVRLVSGGQILGTFTFDIDVERSVTTGTRADDYFSYRALDQLYSAVDSAVATADGASAKADEASASVAGAHTKADEALAAINGITTKETADFELTGDDYTTYSKKYMRDDGVVIESELWDYYVIPAKPGEKYTITTTSNQRIVAWSELSASGTLIGTAEKTPSQMETTGTITISDGTDILVVNHRTSRPTAIIKTADVWHISEDESKLVIERSGLESVKVIDTTAIFADDTALSTAQRWFIASTGNSVVKVPMYQGMHLLISTNATNSGIGFGFFSAADKYIDGTDYASGNRFDVAAPVGTAYAFVTLVSGKTVSIATRTSQLTISNAIADPVDDANPLARLDGFPSLIRCFRKIVCIGDSLTRGQLDTTSPDSSGADVGTAFSYPMQLAKMTGCTVVNCGIGGATASRQHDNNWMDAMERSSAFPAADFLENPGDAYIIALGTNDLSSTDTGNSFSGNVETDIHLLDWRLNANTSVGGYAAIIQRIYQMQPKAKIFCVTIPKTRNVDTSKTDANAKIAAIASMLHCHVIDLYTYAENRYGIFTDFYKNSGLNNALGYNLRARQYIAYIDWIMEHNLEAFRNIAFIGTGYNFVK